MLHINLGTYLALQLFDVIVPLFNIIDPHEESRLLKFLTFCFVFSTTGIAILNRAGIKNCA
jgi:hypothetical protein